MEFQVEEITETAAEDMNRVADVAVGAAAEVADAARHPIETITKQARRLEKRGAPITRAAERDFEKAAAETTQTGYGIVSGALAERVALAGIRVIKDQARRQDLLGDFAYRALKLMNGGFEIAVRTLNRFENASEPPARSPRRVSTSRRRSTRSARAPRSTGRSTRRRSSGQARRTSRRAATAGSR